MIFCFEFGFEILLELHFFVVIERKSEKEIQMIFIFDIGIMIFDRRETG